MSIRFTFNLGCMGEGERNDKQIMLNDVESIGFMLLTPPYQRDLIRSTDPSVDQKRLIDFVDVPIDHKLHTSGSVEGDLLQTIASYEMHPSYALDTNPLMTRILMTTICQRDDGDVAEYTVLTPKVSFESAHIPPGWLKITFYDPELVESFFTLTKGGEVLEKKSSKEFAEAQGLYTI